MNISFLQTHTRPRTDSYSKIKRPQIAPTLPGSRWLYTFPMLATTSALSIKAIYFVSIFYRSEETMTLMKIATLTTAMIGTSAIALTGIRMMKARQLYGSHGVTPVLRASLFKPFYPEGLIINTLLGFWPLVVRG